MGKTMLQMFSAVTSESNIDLQIRQVDFDVEQQLLPDELLVRVEAAPINPSDLGMMLKRTKPSKISEETSQDGFNVLHCGLDTSSSRLSDIVRSSHPCGAEGAGVVIRAGENVEALVGRVVAVHGETYSEYKKVNVKDCVVHKEGTTPAEAASSFVNPMTVLCMLEKFKEGKHKAIIHTAAASNVGQMLQKLCLKEGIPLVNIVRKQEQEDLLREIGAEHVVRSDEETFMEDLLKSVRATKATIAFDALGGGDMADKLFGTMEKVAQASSPKGSIGYGREVMKQVYSYGSLEKSKTTLSRSYGFSYSFSGFLFSTVVAALPPSTVQSMFQRIAEEITTTFKSNYYKEVGLQEACKADAFAEYASQSTGKKFLINPSLSC